MVYTQPLFMPAQRHGIWLLLCSDYPRWVPGIMDDYGNVVAIHPSRTGHSLSIDEAHHE